MAIPEGQEYSLDNPAQWEGLVLRKGRVLEIALAEADASYPADTYGGFLVIDSFLGPPPDGGIDVLVRSLGASDPEVGRQLSSLFNRREGYIHLCASPTCSLDDSYALHVVKFKRFTSEAFHRDYMSAYTRTQMKRWLGDLLAAEER